MTSSDATALSAHAIDDAAARVGASYGGEVDVGEARVALVCAKFNGGITERLLEGAFAGFGLDGATLKPDESSNRALYGKAISNKEIVEGPPTPEPAQPLIAKLSRQN